MIDLPTTLKPSALVAWALISALVSVAGCELSGTRNSDMEVPVWNLAEATPARSIDLGRTRISPETKLPEHLIQQLCPEYTLLTITEQQDWRLLRSQLDLEDAPATLDLDGGMVVGILADIGESASDAWPIHIRQVRVTEGSGWIEAYFTPGVYHPIRSAAYLQLVYVPGLRQIQRISVSQRTFAIHRRSAVH